MDANQEEQASPIDIIKIWEAVLRRKKTLVRSLAICLFITLLIVVIYPASYKSTSTILIEQQEIPQDLVRSTVTSFADQRIETISQRVMTTSNLWGIVEKYNLYKDERERETREYIINEMRTEAINRHLISADVVDPRSGRPTEATIAFQLSFEYENPILAQKVANELTTLFLSENLRTRTQMAEETSEFLDSEADRIKKTVEELEQALATFKENNFESLPELSDLNIRLLDRAEQSLRENELASSSVRERIIYLESELAQLEPNKAIITDQGRQALTALTRLKFSKLEYEQAVSRYSNQHPSVIRLKNDIESLLKQVGDHEAPQLKIEIYELKKSELQARYHDTHPDIIRISQQIETLKALQQQKGPVDEGAGADNPAYLQIKAQLEAAQLELKRLNAQSELLTEDLTKYEARITQSPRIEQLYQQLSRDYQTAVVKYKEVKAKQQEATLGQTLETEQKGEKFTLIEPPLVPEEPNKPNRKLLFVLGVFLSLVISGAIVLLNEMLDKSLRGRKALIEAMGNAPLAIIPMIMTLDEAQSLKKTKTRLILGALIILVALLSLFHVFVKPLDVTWYVVMRKAGWM